MTFATAPGLTMTTIIRQTNPTHELGVWLLALRSFFRPHNHPFSDSERSALNEHDFSREVRIARQSLLDTLRLTLASLDNEPAFLDAGTTGALGAISLSGFSPEEDTARNGQQAAWLTLARSLGAAETVCAGLLENAKLGWQTWNGIGQLLERELAASAAARDVMAEACTFTIRHLPAPLQPLVRQPLVSPLFDAAVRRVFIWFEQLHSRLKVVEDLLRRDQPLKQSLPIFTLLYEEMRGLLDYLQQQVLKHEGVPEEIFDTLDGTAYALQMEMRKVFAHEMVGFSALRPAPATYAKTETAHGLLRNSFQESIVVLARMYAPEIEGAALFPTFQTRLQQSITLRGDLWRLLQTTQRAERERDLFPIERLLGQLEHFRTNSLKYLMYKDLEACERFLEEVAMARGAAELAPVLHRFAAYLETLQGQVNMRTVLAAHPFDYPELEN